MALRLRIVSEHRRALGQRSSIVFGVAGGSIGRSADNDWALPDPARFLSGHHARIHFRHGLFLLEDTSTNGTYLNDSSDPIPKQTPCELHNGDILRLGEYEIVVSIDGSAEHTAERTAGIEVASALAEQPEAATAPRLEDNLDISLSPSALFQVEPAAASGELQVGNAFGQAVVLPFGNRPGPGAPAATPPAENSDIIAARRMEKLKRSVEAREAQSPGARAAFEAFCRGAGIDAAALPAEASVAMLQLAGRLLRESLVGIKDLEVKQTELRRELGLGDDMPDDQTAPFRVTAPADDLISSLLASHNSRRLDAAQWLRQVFEQSKRHDAALATALHAALKDVLQELEPRTLEDRFERSAKRNLMGARPTNWELYGEFFRQLVDTQTDAGLPHLFADRLRIAYGSYGKEDSAQT
jgi:type VI secretion system FHA domain protein